MASSPVKQFYIGNISASIFENVSKNGKKFYSTIFSSSYYDKEKKERIFNKSFNVGYEDLGNVNVLSVLCCQWINCQRSHEHFLK